MKAVRGGCVEGDGVSVVMSRPAGLAEEQWSLLPQTWKRVGNGCGCWLPGEGWWEGCMGLERALGWLRGETLRSSVSQISYE